VSAAALLSGLPLVLVSPPALATPTTAAHSPGVDARSRVDPLFPKIGHPGYDALHYDVRLGFTPTTKSIVATTTVRARAKGRQSSIALDLEGLSVQRVLVNGRKATFTRNGTTLVVRPARAVRGTFTARIDYRGVPVTHIDPDGSKDGWIPTKDGATALNEPVGSMTWFPNNNTPRDKATFTFAITAPSGLKVASNGLLASRHRRGTQTTWTWRQPDQMATYLALVSIGNYDMYHSTMRLSSGRTLPIWSFVDPGLGTLAEQRKLIPTIIRFQERHFGRYPFRSAGIVVKPIDVGYALETQNRPFFDRTPDTSTLVHELAHQWYGDSVTPKTWGDIWLNEGFATDAEHVWDAAHGGPTTAETFQSIYDKNAADSDLWRPPPVGFKDPADLFGAPVYERGALTLEALREKVRSRTMDKILRRWAQSRRGTSVTTHQFIVLAEQVSGQDLRAFFRTWLKVAKRPQGY
jgi:aminopeptidase N